jgi:hypothetical protein
MRLASFIAGVLSLTLGLAYLTTAVPASAADKTEKHVPCANCGMYTEISSTRIVAQVKVDGKTAAYNFECVGCMHEKLEEWGSKADLVSFKILDYSTYGSRTEKLVDGETAWYLFGTKELENSMGEPEYIAAFATKEGATKAKAKLGGDLVQGWDAVLDRIEAAEAKTADATTTKVASKEDPAQPEAYICPCTGGCCDDIKSDKPGTCPRCGMQLVKKK